MSWSATHVRITRQPRNPLTSQCQVDSGAGCGVVDGDGEVLPVVVLGEGPTDRVPGPLLPDVVCVAVTLPVVLTERLVLPDALAVSLGVAVELAVLLALGDDDADEHAVETVEPISLAVPAQTTRATPKGTQAQVAVLQLEVTRPGCQVFIASTTGGRGTNLLDTGTAHQPRSSCQVDTGGRPCEGQHHLTRGPRSTRQARRPALYCQRDRT